MQIVLFIVDNSASMGQRCYLGTRLLDVAKGAVETFMKLRSRDPASRNDRYMLVTLDDAAHCIKAGWKEMHAALVNKLKYLKTEGLTTLGQALRTSFDLLSVNRLISSIDTYGQGRSPFFLEPAMIIAITDGGKLSNKNGVQQELHLPMNDPLPGSELTKEPFRWDQRLFSLVLRLPATTTGEPETLGSVPSDPSPISLMCEVTGGRSYSVTSQKTLMQCLESLAQKVQGGVVINFECIDPEKKLLNEAKQQNGTGQARQNDGGDRSVSPALDSSGSNNDGWASLHRMIYVKPSPKSGVPIGHWPLPEAFWPDHNAPSLPPRTAHPILRYSCVETEPMLVPSFPYDKYELEPSPLTQVLLEKKNPNACWPVFVDCSGKYSGTSTPPCGYLKASSNLSSVNLFVMPYNYSVALPLIERLIKHKMQPMQGWRAEFEEYLKTLPSYYVGPFRKAMRQLGAPSLIPDNYDIGLSHSVLSYFKKLKQQAKISAERVMNSVAHDSIPVEKGIRITSRYNNISVTQLPNFNQILASVAENAVLMPKMDLNEFPNFHVSIGGEVTGRRRMYHNPFDIPRSELLGQIRKMRINFHRSLLSSNNHNVRVRLLQDKAELHNQPISNMGNYQEYLKKMPQPLRELDPDTPKRVHTFGNPFKLAKEKGMLIDETEDYDGPSENKSKDPGKRRGRKRSSSFSRPGTPPIFKRSFSPPVSPKLSTSNSAVVAKPSKPPHVNNPPSIPTAQTPPLIAPPSVSDVPAESKDTENPSEDKKIAEKVAKKLAESQKITPEIEARNVAIKEKVIKLVRRPGKHDVQIFRALQKLKGPKKCWKPVLCDVIKEAHRFKKDNLIQLLKRFEAALEKHLRPD